MDSADRLIAAIRDAAAGNKRLTIAGSGSKHHVLPVAAGDMLTTAEHSGIVAYDPAELVVTARAGTPLKMLQAELAAHNQQLACDPPQFFGEGTVGGMVAAGLSGPGRPWAGAVRDAVLGVVMVNGMGERLTYGGQVMKNVAGYDVSRLMAGSFGSLGVILEVSLRVAPLWEEEVTLALDMSADDAIQRTATWRQRYLPLQGTWWQADKLYVRLGGSAAGVSEAQQMLGETLGGDRVSFPWDQVRDQALDFFKPVSAARNRGEETLWRLILPPATPLATDPDDTAIMWGGGLRWCWANEVDAIADHVSAVGGWAWAMGQTPNLPDADRRVMQQLKAAFDPEGLFVSSLSFNAPEASDAN